MLSCEASEHPRDASRPPFQQRWDANLRLTEVSVKRRLLSLHLENVPVLGRLPRFATGRTCTRSIPGSKLEGPDCQTDPGLQLGSRLGVGVSEAPRAGPRTGSPRTNYLWEGVGPFAIGTAIPPWGQSVNLELTPGEPYYPRDDVEAGKLAEQLEWQEAFEASPKEVGRPGWLDHGRLRRITPREAYRIRKRKEHTDGMGS